MLHSVPPNCAAEPTPSAATARDCVNMITMMYGVLHQTHNHWSDGTQHICCQVKLQLSDSLAPCTGLLLSFAAACVAWALQGNCLRGTESVLSLPKYWHRSITPGSLLLSMPSGCYQHDPVCKHMQGCTHALASIDQSVSCISPPRCNSD